MRIHDILVVFGLFQSSQASAGHLGYNLKMILDQHPAAASLLEENKEFCYALEQVDWDVWKKCYDKCEQEGASSESQCSDDCEIVLFVVEGHDLEATKARYEKWQTDLLSCIMSIDIERVVSGMAEADLSIAEADPSIAETDPSIDEADPSIGDEL